MENQKEETIIVPIPFKKVWKKTEKGWSGKMTLFFEDTTARVKDDNNKEIGTVKAGIGCKIFLQSKDRETELYATPQDIWNAYCKAINKEDLIL